MIFWIFDGKLAHGLRAAAVGTALAFVGLPTLAQDNPLDRENIETTYSEINKMIDEMAGAITTAESALADVEAMEVEDGRQAANQLFAQLKTKVNGMLEGMAPNSVLMDNLEGAKANVIVLNRWFGRQPPEYPDRDKLIMQLDETIKSYDDLSDLILLGRQDAQDALKQLSRAQFYQQMAGKVRLAKQSVEVTKKVVTSLQDLSSKIRQLAEQEMPEAIPN